MSGFSDDDALWGPTISQEMPTQYQGSPFDPPPRAMTVPSLTPVAADAGGMDWNKIIQGISMAGLAGIAAGQGDTMAGMRMMQFQQESGRRDQAMKMQQDQAELKKLEVFPNVLELIDEAQNEPDEEKRGLKLKTISPLIGRIYPDMTEDSITKLANGGGGKVADLIKTLPAASKLYRPQEQGRLAQLLSKDPTKARKEISTRALQSGLQQLQKGEDVDPDIEAAVIESTDRKELNERQGSTSVSRLIAFSGTEDGKELKSMSRAQLLKLAPGLVHANDDQMIQLVDSGFTNVRTKGMIETAARNSVTEERDAKREAERDKNTERQNDIRAAEHRDRMDQFQQSHNRLIREGQLDRTASRDREDRREGAQNFRQEDTIRREFQAQSKEYKDIRNSYAKIQASAKDPSAAGDLSMIFAYMKLLDPISVVREGEQATAENARSVPDRIRNLYNKAMTGKKLEPNQRADFVDRAERLYKSAEEIQKQRELDTRSRAVSYGLDPNRVVADVMPATPPGSPGSHTAAPAPAAGPRKPPTPEEIRAARKRLGLAN
jgi:hypothetical protein